MKHNDTSISLPERLKDHNDAVLRVPAVAQAMAYLEHAFREGGGRISTASVFEDAPGGPASRDLQIAISALRASGAVEMVASYPLELGCLEVGEPQSTQLLALYARKVLPDAAGETVHMHFVLKPALEPALKPAAAPSPAHGPLVSRQVADGKDFDSDDLESLLKRLSDHGLDPGNNRIEDEGHGAFRFHGNFSRLSAVFDVRSNDPLVVLALTAAIDANRRRPEYLPDVQAREAAAREYQVMLEAAGDAGRLRAAQAEWSAIRPQRAGEIVHSPAVTQKATPGASVHQKKATPAPRR